MSAIDDDQDLWDEFKHDHKLTDTNWKLYSIEHKFALEGWQEHQLSGVLLIRFVRIALALNEAKNTYIKQLELLKAVNAI